MDYCNKQRILTTMTGLCVSAATGFLAIAVSTDYWLFTSEKNEDGNETASPTYTHVYSGLWHRCQYEGKLAYCLNCQFILLELLNWEEICYSLASLPLLKLQSRRRRIIGLTLTKASNHATSHQDICRTKILVMLNVVV